MTKTPEARALHSYGDLRLPRSGGHYPATTRAMGVVATTQPFSACQTADEGTPQLW